MSSKKKTFDAYLLLWILLLGTAIAFFFITTGFAVFPSKYKSLLMFVLAAVVLLMFILYIKSRKKGRVFVSIINLLLSVCLVAGSFFIKDVDTRMRGIFTNIDNLENAEVIYNVYSLNDEYLASHPEIKTNVPESEDYKDYAGNTYICKDDDSKGKLKDMFEDELEIIDKEDVISAVEALYSGEGELLVLNDSYVSAIEEFDDFKNFSKDTKVVFEVLEEIIPEEPVYGTDITNTPFTVYVAGEDTRRSNLSTYGRTDVNLLAVVNPNTKQVMIVGIPRDAYVNNPALRNGEDKLTHLGNNGITNSMKGVSNYLGIDIEHYLVVNFVTFKKIIDAVGGVDIYNPYYFNTYGGNGASYSSQNYEFPKGNIHLTGDSGLAYVRERYNLPKGDFDRNEHQTIVLKGLVQKLSDKSVIYNYQSILDALQGQFLTDVSVDDIYKLISMQLGDMADWTVINYHLGGKGDMCGTVSMGWGRKLYVVHLFDSQISLIQEEYQKMYNNEVITQQELPNSSDTKYIPN